MWSHDYFERILHSGGFKAVAGVDEVGRGALAGPVVAAAVVLSGGGDYSDIRDSKILTPRQRERLAQRIRAEALAVGIGSVAESEIDRINILQATHIAMRLALDNLCLKPDAVLVDGFWLPGIEPHCVGIVHGDSLSYSIGAASIIAKVHRDAWMTRLDERFPQYGFARNKGYGTREHLDALSRHGPVQVHRLTFGGTASPPEPGGDHGK
jgi:ribonuclease HII